MKQSWKGPLNKIDDYRWEIPQDYASGMRVPGLIYASSKLLEMIRRDQAPEQVANVAFFAGDCQSFPCYAGHPLGVWFPDWGSSSYYLR